MRGEFDYMRNCQLTKNDSGSMIRLAGCFGLLVYTLCALRITVTSFTSHNWLFFLGKQIAFSVRYELELSSFFSSFYWASVANAPNVLQPYWLIVLPLDVPDLTASLLL